MTPRFMKCATQKTCRVSSIKLAKSFHTHIRVNLSSQESHASVARIPLESPKVLGIAVSRGTRGHQEDSHQFAVLSLDPEELRRTAKLKFGVDWDPVRVGESISRQVVYLGVYDGHGGAAVSLYLHQHLHGLFESADSSHIPEIFAWMREIGGYFKRFRGGVLAPWFHQYSGHASRLASSNAITSPRPMDLEVRATLAFLEADKTLSEGHEAKTCGSTASVALLHPLDMPQIPFFAASRVALTVAHCGDSRVLLCSTDGGRAYPMTQNHHASTRSESARLRRTGTGVITDAFGETRWMGALANTRSIGDAKYKALGITAEPEITTKLLHGLNWAYMIMVTDGISSVLSDDEIVDLARDKKDPKSAADAILAFAEEMGSEDNMTVLVAPLAGWGKVRGPDRTKELRAYRSKQAEGSERQKRM